MSREPFKLPKGSDYYSLYEKRNATNLGVAGNFEKARRLAHGYRNFENYRLRMLLAASGTRGFFRSPMTRLPRGEPAASAG